MPEKTLKFPSPAAHSPRFHVRLWLNQPESKRLSLGEIPEEAVVELERALQVQHSWVKSTPMTGGPTMMVRTSNIVMVEVTPVEAPADEVAA